MSVPELREPVCAPVGGRVPRSSMPHNDPSVPQPRHSIRERAPTERVAYVEGFAAGWKEAVEFSQAVLEPEALERLDEILDLMSAVENDLREKGA